MDGSSKSVPSTAILLEKTEFKLRKRTMIHRDLKEFQLFDLVLQAQTRKVLKTPLFSCHTRRGRKKLNLVQRKYSQKHLGLMAFFHNLFFTNFILIFQFFEFTLWTLWRLQSSSLSSSLLERREKFLTIFFL